MKHINYKSILMTLLLMVGVSANVWGKTVYCISEKEEVKIHFWGNGTGSNWGTKPSMTVTGQTATWAGETYRAFSYDINTCENCIFIPSDQSQTSDLTAQDGKYYVYNSGWFDSWNEAINSLIPLVIAGDGNSNGWLNNVNWSNSNAGNKMTYDSGTWSKTYTDVKAGTFNFKICKSDTWVDAIEFKASYNDCSNVTLSQNGTNIKFTTSTDGNITITYDGSNVCVTFDTGCVSPSNGSISGSGSFYVGENITLTASASGSELNYQWKKDGVNIIGETSATLTINNCQTTDEGTYSCEISNSCGSITPEKAITVSQATIYLVGRFTISDGAGNLTHTGSNASGWNETSTNIPFVYDAIAGLYKIETHRTIGEIVTPGNYYFHFYTGNSAYGATSQNVAPGLESDKKDVEAGTKNFVFTSGEGTDVVLWLDWENKKFWYSCTAETKYAVTINNGDHGTVSPNGEQQVGASGISITATPAAGYIFDRWEVTDGAAVANATTATTTLTATATGTVTATWREANQIKIYFYNDKDWGTVKVHKWGGSAANTTWPGDLASPETITHDGHSIYSVSFTEGDYSNIIFNNGNGTQTSSIGDLITHNESCVRYKGTEQQWEWITLPTQNYQITFGTRIQVTGGRTSGSYVDEGTELVFTAASPASGYEFTGFYSDNELTQEIVGSGVDMVNRKYTTTINSDVSVYVLYTELQYTVSVVAGEHGAITNPAAPATTVEAGVATNPTITAAPDSHYYFNNWTTDGGASVTSATSANTTVSATANGTVTANFTPSWSVRGEFNSWGAGNYIEHYEGNTGYADIELGVGTFDFKVFHHGEANAYGNSGTMTRENCTGWTMSNSQGTPNCRITTDKAGIHRFSFDVDTKKLTVTYPAPDPTLTLTPSGYQYIDQTIEITPTTNQVGELYVCYSFTAMPDGSTAEFTPGADNKVTFVADKAGTYTISAQLRSAACPDGGELICTADPIDVVISNSPYKIYIGYANEPIQSIEYHNGYAIDLEAGKEYDLKIVNVSTDPYTWYGNGGTMTATNCTGWTFSSGVGTNAALATTIAGTYTFDLDVATMKLTAHYPNIDAKEDYSSSVRRNNPDIMLQGFYWEYTGTGTSDPKWTKFGSTFFSDLISEVDEIGSNFDLVWLPPTAETADQVGYLPKNYSHQGNQWGTLSQLQSIITRLHAKGSKVIADIVLNHVYPTATQTTWRDGETFNFGQFREFTPSSSWITADDEGEGEKGSFYDEKEISYRGGSYTWHESEYNCQYARDLAHRNREVREMSRAYLNWMKHDIGFDGWRYDFMKGFHGSHISDYNSASGAYFSVCEMFEGDVEKLKGFLRDAGSNTYMFDFPAKYEIMNNGIAAGNYNNLSAQHGLIYADPAHAVTFVDNHDSFRESSNLSGAANTITNAGNQVLQANAYILSMPGVPCVFYPYWHEYKEEIKAMIRARKLAGIHSESTVEEPRDGIGEGKYCAKITGTHGSIWLKLGPDAGVNVCPSGFTPAYVGENVGVYYQTTLRNRFTFTTEGGVTYYSNEVKDENTPVSLYLQTRGTLQMQHYDGSNWEDVGEPTAIPAEVTEDGVYVAYMDMENNSLREVTAYTGNYYIRTDKVGWSNFKNTDHLFSYTDMNSDYNYYFCVWIGEEDSGHYNSSTNVNYAVGNEYNENISNIYRADAFTTSFGNLKGEDHGANVRFTWNSHTGAMSRAYIAGSSSTGFLTVEGELIYTDNTLSTPITSPQNLNDLENWVYQYSLTAKSGATLTIKAVYDDQTQIFVNNKQIFKSGNDEDYCVMNVLYDFKTNHIISAWTPTGEINSELTINTDILLMREGQNPPTQMTFGAGGSITGDEKTIYGGIHFSKDELQKCKNATEGRSRYMGSLYWISFPFDVKLSDVIGLGAYGQYWLIRYYDGAERAAKGWFKETSTFWKNVSVSERNNFVLRANEGYMLALDLEAVINDLFAHGTDDQFLYFPSASKVTGAINSSIQLTPITYPALTCTITRDDRNIKDSNWRCIGVPSYANAGEIVAAEGLKFFYAWNATNNTLGVSKQGADRGDFQSMHAYMVQFAGTIDWSTRTITPAQAAMRAPQNEESHTLKLVLLQSEKKVDHTYIELMDNTTRAFDESIDLVKMMNSTSNLYTYTIGDNVEVAANSLPLENVTIPLGITAAQDAEYCISLPDGCEGISVTLIDNETGIHTNLALYDYTVSLAKGTYNERFSIQVHANKVMTDMSSIEDRENGIRKLLIDGELFIVKDGQMYDAQGRKY